MKMMKLALLGGAALAVTTASAMADDLDALKSSIESMNTAIIVPTADAPDGVSITWSGYVRQALTYYHDEGNPLGDGFDLAGGRSRLTVNATTPTSVGDVDVHVQFGTSANQTRSWDVSLIDYWGTWHMTPELSFSGGRMFTGGESQSETYGNTVGLSPSFATTTDNALQLGYSSGPVSFIVGVENGDDRVADGGFDKSPDIYANMAWAGDMVSVGLQGNYVMNDPGLKDNYQGGANVDFSLGDAANLHIAGVVGHEECTIGGACFGLVPAADGRGDYWGVAARIKANVTEATYAELSGGYVDSDMYNRYNVNAGMYWAPVDQLKIGVQGDWTNTDTGAAPSTDAISASLVSWWRF